MMKVKETSERPRVPHMTTEAKMAKNRIILRTDAGLELGRFRTTHEARAFAETLGQDILAQVLVIQTDDGVVMSRRWPDDCLDELNRLRA